MRILFFRNYEGFTGGQLKLAQIALRMARWGHQVGLHFTRPPVRDTDFPWSASAGIGPVDDPAAFRPDLLVLAGDDWHSAGALAATGLPVIHFVQGFRPLRPPLAAFLARPALRIATSPPVAEALAAHAPLNGPVQCVPNHLDPLVWDMPVPTDQARGTVLILGVKQPALAAAAAQALQSQLPGQAVELINTPVARAVLLQRLAQCRVAMVLPQADEGFHLPSLEAMRLGAAVVTTDAIGNRWHCRDGETARIVPAQADTLAAAIVSLVADDGLRARLARGGAAFAANLGPQAEDLAWAQALARAGAPWAAAGPTTAACASLPPGERPYDNASHASSHVRLSPT